ncbi:MBL fold metallo-hydrolase [Streptomyces sp. VB1]|uniref:MBL fold metallo-hydrolase n=1 Tax=Streptomyces sp. VB1 TaxID=2986803 RepID=UPI0022429030|nr:MBL fold metallo-hydrolase [Streptomyces sp. VB1]UZI32878.1 MBL fold metallo-hydrolase [Streptomyces sp. VB1]
MNEDTDVQRPQRRTPAFGRRAVLRGAAIGAAAPLLSATTTTAAAAGHGAPAAGSASFRWLGTSGWRIDVGSRTVLFDPYITRFKTGLFDGGLKPDTKLRSDPALVREHVGSPEIVLVSHAHWDHIADVPHIAKSTGARIVGTETTFHLLVAFGVDPGQISVVKGGEVLDFNGITVQVVPSLHSRNKRHSYFAPGTLNAPPAAAPRTISDLPEGDTLVFQVTVGSGGPSAFLMGASDFSEQAVRGLSPDLAMIAVPSSAATFRYTSRLLHALDRPGVVVPVHWDNFEEPLSEPPRRDPVMDLSGFAAQVHGESPTSRIVVPDYRTTYGADMRAGTSTP